MIARDLRDPNECLARNGGHGRVLGGGASWPVQMLALFDPVSSVMAYKGRTSKMSEITANVDNAAVAYSQVLPRGMSRVRDDAKNLANANVVTQIFPASHSSVGGRSVNLNKPGKMNNKKQGTVGYSFATEREQMEQSDCFMRDEIAQAKGAAFGQHGPCALPWNDAYYNQNQLCRGRYGFAHEGRFGDYNDYDYDDLFDDDDDELRELNRIEGRLENIERELYQ
jgi:hypothetical protein